VHLFGTGEGMSLQDDLREAAAEPLDYGRPNWLLLQAADELDRLTTELAAAKKENEWQPIETAPKGGGAEFTSDPAWVQPPLILLLCDGKVSVGRWQWYYAEGGVGYRAGLEAWAEPISGELLALEYGNPTHWKLPAPLDAATGIQTPFTAVKGRSSTL
jgi:hypothetical protein